LGRHRLHRVDAVSRYHQRVEGLADEHVGEHPESLEMTDTLEAVSPDDLDIRWQKWLVRGAEADRGRAKRVNVAAVGVGVALAIALVLQFV
jgi:hypothetical protein